MKKLFSIFVVIMIAMIFFINSNFATEKLETPKNVKWSETEPGVVTFSQVENADGYSMYVLKDGTEIGVGGGDGHPTEFSIQELIRQHGLGTYTVKIYADSNVLPSSEPAVTTYEAKKLSKPENTKWSETEPGVVSFSEVKYADGYSMSVSKDGKEIGTGGGEGYPGSFSIQELINQHGLGTYTVKIYADSNVLPSSEPAEATYVAKQLSKPENLKWSETEPGVVSFSAVKYAEGYNMRVLKDGKEIGAGGGAGYPGSFSIKELIKQHGEGKYTVEITATSSVLPSSEKATTSYTAKKEENDKTTSTPSTDKNDEVSSSASTNKENTNKNDKTTVTNKVNTNKNDKTTATNTNKKIEKIEVTKAPTKTVYKVGESFENTGMIVTATYSDGSTQEITDYKIADGENLELGQNRVLLHYTDGDREIEAFQEITVEEVEETETIETNATGTDTVEKNNNNSSKVNMSIIIGAVAFVIIVVIVTVIIVSTYHVKKKNK